MGIAVAIGEKLEAFDSLVKGNEEIRHRYHVDELMKRYKMLLSAVKSKDPETIREVVVVFLESLEKIQK